MLLQLGDLFLDLAHLRVLLREAHAHHFPLHLERHDGAAEVSARFRACLRARVDGGDHAVPLLELQQLVLREVDLPGGALELGLVEHFLAARLRFRGSLQSLVQEVEIRVGEIGRELRIGRLRGHAERRAFLVVTGPDAVEHLCDLRAPRLLEDPQHLFAHGATHQQGVEDVQVAGDAGHGHLHAREIDPAAVFPSATSEKHAKRVRHVRGLRIPWGQDRGGCAVDPGLHLSQDAGDDGRDDDHPDDPDPRTPDHADVVREGETLDHRGSP